MPVLQTRKEFLRVQGHGRKFRGKHLLLLIANGPNRIGLTVSRKVGNAVIRNRVRRRLREILRTHPDLLCSGYDHVVVALPSAAGAEYFTMTEELTCLLERARDWVSHKRSSSD
ncbi:MAG: ribonuclease P protein component [Deltaproteobacteria bacterium RIFOXYA12_FULL_58_15]|nr:MAG: ribonuclease P protein component [Deltaproteobacteria bacterium RIFOXYA12_FULL_58_15]OGR11509.1 MAG: ribonuclease P protein component [Deltaproteobacteria bacterium RIFOXYB12_FULL_58_9]